MNNYIPYHEVHYMCDNHTRKHKNGEYESKCCVCNGMQGCLEDNKEQELNKLRKKHDEERETIKKITYPEFFQED